MLEYIATPLIVKITKLDSRTSFVLKQLIKSRLVVVKIVYWKSINVSINANIALSRQSPILYSDFLHVHFDYISFPICITKLNKTIENKNV